MWNSLHEYANISNGMLGDLYILSHQAHNTKHLFSFARTAFLSLIHPNALVINRTCFHHASINNPACSAVSVPCTAPLTTVTKPVHSASGSNSTYPTSGYNGTTWIHYEQMISKVGILWVYQKWRCTISSPLMTSHRARMFWKVEQAKLTDMPFGFLFCFERKLPSTLYCYGSL